MTQDQSKFQSPEMKPVESHQSRTTIKVLGWHSFFAQQINADVLARTPPVRIVEIHRSGLHVIGDGVDQTIPPRADATVGDWVLLDQSQPQSSRVLERTSLLKRRAPGSDRQIQLIAANIDTAFIVSSCNQDFNVARLERYIALALEAEIIPVVVLTKADLAMSVQTYVDDASAISPLVRVITLDARGEEPSAKLAEWCAPGKTIAFLGSSGVGKSTLTNALMGTQSIETQSIRENDSKGRHTTTTRQLHVVSGGCLVIDTPGMRELKMTDVAGGIEGIFADLYVLSTQCKFRDCKHEVEPGCALHVALERGTLDPARLARWRKLLAEDLANSESLNRRKSKSKPPSNAIRPAKKKSKK